MVKMRGLVDDAEELFKVMEHAGICQIIDSRGTSSGERRGGQNRRGRAPTKEAAPTVHQDRTEERRGEGGTVRAGVSPLFSSSCLGEPWVRPPLYILPLYGSWPPRHFPAGVAHLSILWQMPSCSTALNSYSGSFTKPLISPKSSPPSCILVAITLPSWPR